MNLADVHELHAQLPPELQRALAFTVARSLRVLRVPPAMTLSEWADRHFYLSSESSYIEGRWQSWPFQRTMLDVMGDDEIAKVTIRKSARVGYTKMLLAFIGYSAEHKRRNGVVYQPTDDDRDEFVTAELEPMLRDVRVMRSVMPRFSRRSKDNTLRLKKFTTGMLHLRGGKAAKNYRRLTCDFVVYDEFSGFDRDIEKEGSPGKLGDKRLEGAVWPKSIAGSTPKTKHNDNTEDREAEADVYLRWQVPCAHCHQLHPITLGGKDKTHGLKWTDGDTSTAAHYCPHCGVAMSQAEYLEQWHGGLWVCERTGQWVDQRSRWRTPQSLQWQACELEPDPATLAPKPAHVAMHVWTAAAPQAAWRDVADEFVAAARLAERGDKSLLKTFVNTTLGETWEEKGETADEHALQQRAEDYPLATVPIGALVLTAGIDLQGNRWEIGVWGWGQGMESWDVDHHIIEGNAQSDDDWAQVEQYLLRRYPQAWHGGTLGIDSISIDSNYQTQAVFNFVRRMQHRMRIHAVRGEGAEGLPIKGPGRAQEVNWKGQRWPNGIKQWSVGVDSAKDMLHDQLQLTRAGPGYVHLNKHRSREWLEQLTAEQRVFVKSATGSVQRWLKRRPRNEVLDCRNYALHAAYMLGLPTWTDKRWEQQAQAVQPPPDLFSARPVAVAPTALPSSAPAVPVAVEVAAAQLAAVSRPQPARQAPRRW